MKKDIKKGAKVILNDNAATKGTFVGILKENQTLATVELESGETTIFPVANIVPVGEPAAKSSAADSSPTEKTTESDVCDNLPVKLRHVKVGEYFINPDPDKKFDSDDICRAIKKGNGLILCRDHNGNTFSIKNEEVYVVSGKPSEYHIAPISKEKPALKAVKRIAANGEYIRTLVTVPCLEKGSIVRVKGTMPGGICLVDIDLKKISKDNPTKSSISRMLGLQPEVYEILKGFIPDKFPVAGILGFPPEEYEVLENYIPDKEKKPQPAPRQHRKYWSVWPQNTHQRATDFIHDLMGVLLDSDMYLSFGRPGYRTVSAYLYTAPNAEYPKGNRQKAYAKCAIGDKVNYDIGRVVATCKLLNMELPDWVTSGHNEDKPISADYFDPSYPPKPDGDETAEDNSTPASENNGEEEKDNTGSPEMVMGA